MTTINGHDYCPTLGTPYIYSDDCKPGTRIIHKTRCKQWTCPYCAPINQMLHEIRIKNGIRELQNKGYKFAFVTLTSHERLKTFEETYRVWQSAWRKLSERYRRFCAKTLGVENHYVYVIERHKDGRMHVHGFFCADITKRWWKDSARQCGLGYQVDKQLVSDDAKVVSYITKYLSKQQGKDYTIKGVRRVAYSQKFPATPGLDSTSEWTVAEKDESIVSLVEYAWHVLHEDVELHGKKITEIVDN